MYNPSRRNRNIGTARQGHGQDNRLNIPESWHDCRLFYEKLRRPVRIKRTVGPKELMFLVEKPLADYRHCCTVDDICRMLGYIPESDWSMLDIVVLRQPTRKQKILSNVWGRLSYYYETDACSGVAIVLESQPRDSVVKFPKSLCPQDQKKIERLSRDGHDIRFQKRQITIRSTVAACRNTQLFRTLPHEIGHYCHYRRIGNDKRYGSIPANEREAAADRYADELATVLRKDGRIPFDRIIEPRILKMDNLPNEWF